jgi:hypothetical protein
VTVRAAFERVQARRHHMVDMNQSIVAANVAILVLTMATAVFGGPNQSVAYATNYSATLHYEKEIALSAQATQVLYSNAIQLLETSNFNSRTPPASSWLGYGVAETQDTYRKAVSGKYLLVSFKETRPIKTLGGEVSVKELVVGLNSRDVASSLHTIDEQGRIVGHGKYSGPLCSMIREAAAKIAKEATASQN